MKNGNVLFFESCFSSHKTRDAIPWSEYKKPRGLPSWLGIDSLALLVLIIYIATHIKRRYSILVLVLQREQCGDNMPH